MKNKGFTLAEMLAVIVLLAVLVLMVVPNAVKLFNRSKLKSIKTQENSILDASNLFVTDFCKKSISGNINECPSSYRYATGEQKYVCLEDIQEEGYIDIIKYNGTVCKGLVIYEKGYDERYSNGQIYLFCGEDYSTDNSLNKSIYNHCNL